VDYLLQAQDLNLDGLLAPSELLSPSTIDQQQESNIVLPDSPADEALKQEQTHAKSEDGDTEVKKESQQENETQDPAKEEHTQEEKPVDHEIPEQLEEQDELQDDHQEQKNMPVHQEQPEM